MNDLTTVRVETVEIMSGVADKIKDHAIRENDKGGYEAIGLLAGARRDPRVGFLLPLVNHSATPQDSFFVEPWEQYRAEQAISDAELDIRGIYHSHPVGEAEPSGMDGEMARPRELMIIYSVAFGDLRGWREKEGSLNIVNLKIVDPDEQDE